MNGVIKTNQMSFAQLIIESVETSYDDWNDFW
jgi:hypothetical protein